MEKQIRSNGHVVLVPVPYQGHVTPMLQLGKALHAHGFTITVAHPAFNSPDPRGHPDFAFFPMPDGLQGRGHTPADLAGNGLIMNESCREAFRGLLREKVERGERIRCVVSDELLFFAEDVACDMAIPSMVLRTTSAATSFARTHLVVLAEEGRTSVQGLNSEELVPELPPLRFKDLPFSPSKNFGPFATLINRAYKNRKSSAIIWNTMACLEQPILDKIQHQQSHVPTFPIGPLHKISPSLSTTSLISEDRSCVAWLDKQPENSVIYVSLTGSIASIDEQDVQNISRGLAESGQRFLWVIRPGSIRGSDVVTVPERLCGEKGYVVKWAPQAEVIAHKAVGGFWSHCGWNSTLESLAAGVPMLCSPCFGDQKVNARYVCHVWRAGMMVEELESGEIAGAVRRVIEEGGKMRERANELKERIENSMRKGGPSYESFNDLLQFVILL